MPDIQIEVEIGERALAFRDEQLARKREHRIEDASIGDVIGAHLAIDHFLARGRETGHLRTLKCGRCRGLALAASLEQAPRKRNTEGVSRPC